MWRGKGWRVKTLGGMTSEGNLSVCLLFLDFGLFDSGEDAEIGGADFEAN